MPYENNFSLLIIIVISTFLTTVFVLIFATAARWKDSLSERLQGFTPLRTTPTMITTNKVSLKHVLTKFADLAPLHWSKKLEKELLRADVPLNGGEFLVLQMILTLFFSLIGLSVSHQFLVGPLMGILGIIAPRIWLKKAHKNKSQRFNNQLVDALLILANSLKAGFSFMQALDLVSHEMPDPIARELQFSLREMNYGTPTEQALLNLNDRIGSDDLDLLVTAILIQRQVGGNLAEVLLSIHSTIQDRIRIKQEIQTLTAQGRMSGYVIAVLPFGIAAILTLMNPSYMVLMVTKPLGWAMIGGGLTSEFIGFLFIRKIIAIKV